MEDWYHQWQKPELGTKVSDADEICVDGKISSKKKEKHFLYSFNKPSGIVCTFRYQT